MILRSKFGTMSAVIPGRWTDSDGNVHEYPADLEALTVTFVDTANKVSSSVEFIKIGD